ncbi:unnamed protein product [Vitrella brassicaformis CCMP3155]|uniref:Photosystem II 12 kDa extrinsic protein n=2 Tax=Vitrella brassicaformis TaxID=1169539 RepID=A0A0G4FFF0_VITBC|nr:unnamed protein product [Vitrella brassicaformis CCMP3155]|eukprot:CEM11926.1 unnamed protein product [Vitrella brassicaformis CCMP3155]
MKAVIALALSFALCAEAYVLPAQRPTSLRRQGATSLRMMAEDGEVSRRNALMSIASLPLAAALFATPFAAEAVRDYDGVGYLGGAEKIDLNNANVRVYQRLPGMYPTLGAKLAKNGPYQNVKDVYSIKGLSEREKELLKKYESDFVVLQPREEYTVDKFNNGLYR